MAVGNWLSFADTGGFYCWVDELAAMLTLIRLPLADLAKEVFAFSACILSYEFLKFEFPFVMAFMFEFVMLLNAAGIGLVLLALGKPIELPSSKFAFLDPFKGSFPKAF